MKTKPKATFKIKVASTTMWLIMGGLIPVYNLIGYCIFFLNHRTRHKILASWSRIFTFLGKHLCGIDYEIIGKENLIKGPAVFASNHQSTWETMAFNVFLPKHVWILKQELTKIPFFGWTLRLLSPIAIDRSDKSRAVLQILEQSKQRIADGFWIMVFPEGTRLPPGTKQAFKTGVARMAINLNVPVIPIAHNAGHIMPRRSFWMYPGKVTIRIGNPIYPEQLTPEQLTEKIRSTIYQELIEMGEI
ncbi:MAG: 1-acyl-sn-glycerol-3-phosphate acyltransferase [Burkholderiales bacterium]|nr:1-acyl-sn-glycerol-3-phosphate acyltransferase [Burkholderiales bacterium]